MAAEQYLFVSFRDNGQAGVYFALSEDGYVWTPLKDNRPVVTPQHSGMLMRDPFITRGPDRTYHLLWTTGWERKKTGQLTIGHAVSRDLVNWSTQQLVDIPLPGARNAWAPEMVWDAAGRKWIIFWASTIPGKFASTDATGDDGYNHRIYSMTTRDFLTFTKPAIYFDPGYNVIDATVVHDGARWIMVFKDERKNPLQKRLRTATSTSPCGPWRNISQPFTEDWVEGPSAIQIGKKWLIYFDHYMKPRFYGAYLTRDWKSFQEVSDRVRFPEEQRHGTAIAVDETEARRLTSLK